ncbi:MAG TPA: hypothetical protein PLT75_03020 [Spirochaetota bacterium]|nr:hypothetical protein [Spirochaetota bacterium]
MIFPSEIRNTMTGSPGIFYNILFSVYAWLYTLLLQPCIFSYSGNVFSPGTETGSDFIMGAIMISVLVLETAGIFYKTRDIRFRLSQPEGTVFEPPLNAGGIIFLFAIFHILGSFFICFIMLSACAIPGDSNLGVFIFFCVFLRELYLWYLAFLSTYERNSEYRTVSPVMSFAANSFLVLYGCIAYTAVWEVLAHNFTGYFQRPDLFSSIGSVIQFIFVIAGIGIACFILFLPTRFAFHLEEMTFLKKEREKRIYYVTLIIASINAIVPFTGL